ncbi:MAG: hypothetical protein K6T35_14530, partial [Meiothermus silvanus]|nr:hypothetical protein [Allomeiothermus silvanus]
SAVEYVRIGPVGMMFLPGEVPGEVVNGLPAGFRTHPERWYAEPRDRHAFGEAFTTGGYVTRHMRDRHRWTIGLGSDELGYFVPLSNFRVRCVADAFAGEGTCALLHALGAIDFPDALAGTTCKRVTEDPGSITWGEPIRTAIVASCRYGQALGEAAGHYEALQALARKTGRFRPIFYSTDDLTLIYPDPPAEPVARRDRLYVSASLFPTKGQYAMWWAERPGERFLLSRTYEIYDRIYHEVAGLETSAFAQILLELEMIQDEEEFALMTSVPSRIEIPLLGPEGVPMVASFSPDRGIRFHLHMRHATSEYRDAFLELFLARMKLWKKESPTPRF